MAGLVYKRSMLDWFASKWLKFNEWSARNYSHQLITDNLGLVDYVIKNYCKVPHFISYGVD